MWFYDYKWKDLVTEVFWERFCFRSISEWMLHFKWILGTELFVRGTKFSTCVLRDKKLGLQHSELFAWKGASWEKKKNSFSRNWTFAQELEKLNMTHLLTWTRADSGAGEGGGGVAQQVLNQRSRSISSKLRFKKFIINEKCLNEIQQ